MNIFTLIKLQLIFMRLSINPVVGGALISGGSSILGGLFGSSSAKRRLEEERRMFNQTFAEQKNQFDNALQIRSRDAKLAGLHPMAALGLTPGGTIAGQSTTGSSRGDSLKKSLVDAGKTVGTALMQKAAIKQATATDFALQQKYESETALNTQKSLIQPDRTASEVKVFPGGKSAPNLIEYKPDSVISHKKKFPAETAGTHPSLREYTLPNGQKFLAPVNEEGWTEGLESLPYALYPWLREQNIKKYGANWNSGVLESFTAPLKRAWKRTQKKSNPSKYYNGGRYQ